MKHSDFDFLTNLPEGPDSKNKWKRFFLILSDSERWKWAKHMVEPKCGEEGLKVLLNEAHKLYKEEIEGSIKSYKRYSEDFVNSNMFCDAADAWSKNQHNKTIGIIKSLLYERYDLVLRFFHKEQLSDDDLNELIRLINLSTKDDLKKKRKTRTYNEDSKQVLDFGCDLDKKSIEIITNCANYMEIFKEEVSTEDMQALFKCRPERKLTAKNNGLLAVFFNYLKTKGVIEPTWQSVISSRKLIYSSNGNNLLTQKNISAALYQYNTKKSSEKVKTMFNMLDKINIKYR